MVKNCSKCIKKKSYKKNNTKSSRKSKKSYKKNNTKSSRKSKKQSKKQRGGKSLVYVAGIKNAGEDIPGQMAYL